MSITSTSNWKLGAVTAIILAACVFVLFFISINRKVLDSTITLTGVFLDAGGLQTGNSVRLGGVKIGEVDQIEFADDSSIRVYAIIEKEHQQFIHADARMAIGSDGLLGDKVINILKGSSDSSLVKDGDQLATLKPFDASKLLSSFQRTATNFGIMSKEFSKVSQHLNSTKGAIGRFMNDSSFSIHLNHTSQIISQLGSDTSSPKEPKKHRFSLKRMFGKDKRDDSDQQ